MQCLKSHPNERSRNLFKCNHYNVTQMEYLESRPNAQRLPHITQLPKHSHVCHPYATSNISQIQHNRQNTVWGVTQMQHL